ncbi:MAG: ABC transporter [Clostridiales bacterium]|uniref:ATP-binding cassette domain-containing protein n=1 Tax=Provencibacterium massiliense TaxID=1841868 RepID=UPI0009A81EA5|nr:ATP-binding cassette domain-containing protein [Provencibacterium massiliense]PWM37696.1 MAG: ABC transporter [Clostridiales bacterium]RGB68974.1 ATP-binding cassette domain-containing protein [Harryflintia acetispora]
MLEVKNLTKAYGEKRAVDDITFTVNRGEILGFLGPNGAGKSTTMNIITGYLSSSEGTVTVDGHDILGDPIKAKAKIGYLPEHPPLYLDMTVREYLDFMFDLKKCKLPKKAHIAEICELVKITDVYQRIIKNLSKGYRQRVGLAQALLGNPDLLILDEPTVGLDPKQIIEIRGLIKKLGEKHTVILSSHILPEVQAVCERVIVINKGKLVADDTPDNLSHAMSTDHKLTVRVDGPEDGVYQLLCGLPSMVEVQKLGVREGSAYEYSLEAEPEADVRREMFKRLADRGWPILALRSSELSLEDIFLSLTSDDKPGIAMQDEAGQEELSKSAHELADSLDGDAGAEENGGEA